MNVPARARLRQPHAARSSASSATSGVQEGLVLVNAMHITASVFINDDESRAAPRLRGVARAAGAARPDVDQYRHNDTGEDNADAHLKRQVMGREVVVAITEGQARLRSVGADLLRRVRRAAQEARAREGDRRIAMDHRAPARCERGRARHRPPRRARRRRAALGAGAASFAAYERLERGDRLDRLAGAVRPGNCSGDPGPRSNAWSATRCSSRVLVVPNQPATRDLSYEPTAAPARHGGWHAYRVTRRAPSMALSTGTRRRSDSTWKGATRGDRATAGFKCDSAGLIVLARSHASSARSEFSGSGCGEQPERARLGRSAPRASVDALSGTRPRISAAPSNA